MTNASPQLPQLPGSRYARAGGGGRGSRSPGPAAARSRKRHQAPPSDRGPVHVRGTPKPALFQLAKMHWLTASFRTDPEAVVGNDADGWTGPIAGGRRGFGTFRYEHETGAALYFTPDRDGARACVLDVPGESCEVKGDWLPLVSMLGGKITRVDLAVDIGPAALSRARMVEMRRAWLRGQVDTKVRTFSEHRSYAPGDGFTWYFGGTTSDIRLRCYDRRGPLRLEFQWRPEDQYHLLADVIGRDLDACWRLLASKIVFPCEWYGQLLRGEVAAFSTPAQPTDFERAAQALRDQWGEALWAFNLLGMSPESFLREPVGRLRSSTKSKFKQWAFQAGADRGRALLRSIESL